MAKQILRDARLYVGGFDLSGNHNQLGLEYTAATQDGTTFLSGGNKEKLPGLVEWKGSHRGLWEAAAVGGLDEVLFEKLGLSDEVMSVFPTVPVVGGLGFSGRGLEGEYSPGGKIGDALPFTFAFEGSGPLLRLTCLATGAKTAAGNGTVLNLGAVPDGRRLYAVLHVLAVSAGASLTLKVQSDSGAAFDSPIDRVTFAPAAAVGAWWAIPVAGPITDTYWRAAWSVAGADPNLAILAGMAIQ